ncbi:MAG: IS3 family transposase [Myxococcota bacterium]
MRFAYIRARTGRFPIAWMCRRLGVSTSGFYAWCKRSPSKRAVRNEQLKVQIRALFKRSRRCYGAPRIRDELVARGARVGIRRIARLMREMGLYGRPPKRRKKTTDSEHRLGYAPNLVKQRFTAEQPNTLWMGDISFIRTWEGWAYLAVVIDAFSRRVVGYAIADHMRTELVLEALEMAARRRSPSAGLVFHSDRGSQYASHDFRDALRRLGAEQSMSATGNCFDNAAVESFFSTLKEELIYRHAWPTRARLKEELEDYIDGFYNSERRHSAAGRMSPVEYERGCMRAAA